MQNQLKNRHWKGRSQNWTNMGEKMHTPQERNGRDNVWNGEIWVITGFRFLGLRKRKMTEWVQREEEKERATSEPTMDSRVTTAVTISCHQFCRWCPPRLPELVLFPFLVSRLCLTHCRWLDVCFLIPALYLGSLGLPLSGLFGILMNYMKN